MKDDPKAFKVQALILLRKCTPNVVEQIVGGAGFVNEVAKNRINNRTFSAQNGKYIETEEFKQLKRLQADLVAALEGLPSIGKALKGKCCYKINGLAIRLQAAFKKESKAPIPPPKIEPNGVNNPNRTK